MKIFKNVSRQTALLIYLSIGSIIFTSCSAGNHPEATNNSDAVSKPGAAPAVSLAATPATQLSRSRPQLVKKATVTLIVDSVDKSVEAVKEIVDKQQGDTIKLEDQMPEDKNSRHAASMQVRVPQDRLESSLNAFAKLGTVRNRSLTAEDVGQQLVDFQARLTNLRLTETNLQKIMDRAISVQDVLSVANQLSEIRQSIEQIDAQLKNLQNQVAYSTITLNLEAAVSSNASERNLGTQVQEAWNQSTHSLGRVSVGLLRLGIWLVVYSPLLILVGYIFRRWQRHGASVKRVPEAPKAE